MLRFRLHFLPGMPKNSSNFHKVVRQHTEGVVQSIIWLSLKIYLAFSNERILKIC